ncbi:MAG: hypothetical protein HKO64_09050 [Xanthomonadales bacterium]|nr:hypothetical protein [Xanthomonadales bacterium]
MLFRLRPSIIFCAALLLSAAPAHAQFCDEVLENSADSPSYACADTGYFVDGADGQAGEQLFSDSEIGLLGADFDGLDLFDPQDPDLAAPDSIKTPFFSNIQMNPSIESLNSLFKLRHRGAVSMGARNSINQAAAYNTRSRVTFIPVTIDNSLDPVTLNLSFDFDFTLRDPSDNATTGDAAVIAIARMFDDIQQLVFEFGGLSTLDLATDPEPLFFGDFGGPNTSFEPTGPDIEDEFDVDLLEVLVRQVPVGKRLTLETDTFGQVFSDGFESGDTSSWSVSSDDTFVFTVSSDNPNVRFKMVTEPTINAGMNDAWVSADAPLQGFFFTYYPQANIFFLSWFTFDSVIPGGPSAVFGAADQRWVTGVGTPDGNKVTISVELTSGGVFNDSDPTATQTPNYGTITIEFINCNEALMTYNFPSLGLSGEMTLTRVLTSNVPLCQELASP